MTGPVGGGGGGGTSGCMLTSSSRLISSSSYPGPGALSSAITGYLREYVADVVPGVAVQALLQPLLAQEVPDEANAARV